MGAFLKFIFWLWVGWIVVVLVFQVLAAIFKFLSELVESVSAAPEKPEAPKPTLPLQYRAHGLTLDDVGPPRKLPISDDHSQTYSPLELSVEHIDARGPQSRLEIKIRGGEPDSGAGSITYVITAKTKIGGQFFTLGDGRSIKEIPGPFSKSYSLKIPKPTNGRWITLAAPLMDEVLPPRGGPMTYQFECEAYKADLPRALGLTSPYGRYLEKAEHTVQLSLPAPGYVDEIEWLHVRQNAVKLMSGLVRSCVVNIDQKRSAMYAWMQSLSPVARNGNRRDALKLRLLQTHCDFDRPTVIDPAPLCEVRDTKDTHLMESLARLTLEIAGKEPGGSEPRRAYSTLRDLFNVYLDGKHITTIWPEPPLQVQQDVSPAVPSFELKLVPIEEAGFVKAAEVHVRGSVGSLLQAQTELDFWLWDETAGDVPFLVTSADIDQVHERAVHLYAWKKDEYDPTKWQSAGLIRFNGFMPPAGGPRRISVAGKIRTKMIVGFFNSVQSARSIPVVMNIPTIGYENIRSVRHRLRYRAFVLAEGLALLSGKGPTYRQDKALKKFAQTLCAGIIDRKLAEGCQNDLLTLLDSNVDDSLSGLTRQLDQLAAQAYPELKVQLLDALVEVMASRKVRSKESRDFLEYSRRVLA